MNSYLLRRSSRSHRSSGRSLGVACLVWICGLLHAQVPIPFSVVTNEATITITGYTGTGGDVVIPASINGLPVTSIGIHAFSENQDIRSVVIPDSVKVIEARAFHQCGGLRRVIVGQGVVRIDNEALDARTPICTRGVGGACYEFVFYGPGMEVIFLGSRPDGDWPFGCRGPGSFEDRSAPSRVRYLPGSGAWGSEFGGVTASALEAPSIQTHRNSPVVEDGVFSFNVLWMPGSRVVVEATDGLTPPNWIQIGDIVVGAAWDTRFSDPEKASHPSRLYRVRPL
ncbi:MAG: leucine-rich repeat protein [Verrucomicrobiae bacterium]|nr:leucine-rich repeat protein [Verrucomicrobiae bacterium]